jgi:hypothetical protein
MNATGMKAQPLVGQKAPAIEAVHEPRENSRVKPDPAAHLIAEQEMAAQLIAGPQDAAPQQEDAARQQGVDDEGDIDVVGDSDEDAKAAAKEAAKTNEDTATAKTAIGGVSDVDDAEAHTEAHKLRVLEAIRRSTPYKGN